MEDLFYAERTARWLGRQWLDENGLAEPPLRPIDPPGQDLVRALGSHLIRLGHRLLHTTSAPAVAPPAPTPAEM